MYVPHLPTPSTGTKNAQHFPFHHSNTCVNSKTT